MIKDSRYQRMFYDRFRGYASKVVFRYVYRYEKAMDVVTDGFVKAFMHFETFRTNKEEDQERMVMGWLKKIMINCSIDELRKNSLLPEIGAIEDREIWYLHDKNDDADRLLLYRDLIAMVKDLPPLRRIVFNLYVIDGYSHSEIAEKLNISVGTSKSHLSRARTVLQELIKKMEDGKLCRI
jgi:RNA polymerase sigma-70 factor (ECF subfamily)